MTSEDSSVRNRPSSAATSQIARFHVRRRHRAGDGHQRSTIETFVERSARRHIVRTVACAAGDHSHCRYPRCRELALAELRQLLNGSESGGGDVIEEEPLTRN